MSEQPINLMDAYIGLVKALAWKIHQQLPPSVELDDLVGYGCVGLAEAARSFDGTRGLKFSTFAFYRVRGAILDGLSQMAWFRRDKFEGRAYRHTPDEGDTGDNPSPDEVAEDRGPARTRWAKKAMLQLDQAGKEGSLADSVADYRGGNADRVADAEVQARVRELVDALPKAAAELLRATYYEGLTLKDAAARLGRDKSWASRLHARTLYELGRVLKAEGLA
jgi:RNA polymerase sigma factor for flagellar operon FliA